MDFAADYSYACPAEHLHATLTDRSHVEAKLAATGGGTAVAVGPRRVETAREIKVSLPGFAAKFLSENQRVEQVEEWADPATTRPAFTGTFSGKAAGTPVVVAGTLSIEPAVNGCTLHVGGHIEANVPFVGGKIAEMVREQIVKNLDREHTFTTKWIAEH